MGVRYHVLGGFSGPVVSSWYLSFHVLAASGFDLNPAPPTAQMLALGTVFKGSVSGGVVNQRPPVMVLN